MTRIASISAAIALALGAAMPAFTQENAAPLQPVLDVAESEAEPSVLDRWLAEPTTLFDAAEIDLEAMRYIARPVIVFADSPFDPLFVQQLDLLAERPEGLIARDVILIVDTDPGAATDARRDLRPRGFTLVLIGKDGRVAQRKPAPFDVRDLERAIDKMPLRQQEIRDGAGG